MLEFNNHTIVDIHEMLFLVEIHRLEMRVSAGSASQVEQVPID